MRERAVKHKINISHLEKLKKREKVENQLEKVRVKDVNRQGEKEERNNYEKMLALSVYPDFYQSQCIRSLSSALW